MSKSKKKTLKSTPQQRARDHGRKFEARVARLLDGYVYAGQAGDVVVGDWIIECKYRLKFKLQRLVELGQWIEQAKRNAADWAKKGQPKFWAVVFTGGYKSGNYAVVELDLFKEMLNVFQSAGYHPREPDRGSGGGFGGTEERS